MLSTTDVQKIRGHLLVKAITAQTIMAKFDVSSSGAYNAISGESRSARIQSYIAEQIGYWPYPWTQGEKMERPE